MARLFKRNNKTTIAELEEYYANQNQKKTGAGTAWLMAFLSLLITVVVIAALFFGGRWLYRTVTDDGSDTPETTSGSNSTNGSNVDLPAFDSDVVGQDIVSDDEDSSENEGVVSDEAVSTSESNADRVAAAGPGSTIPNTGAGDIIFIAPAATAIVGYAISRKKQLSK